MSVSTARLVQADNYTTGTAVRCASISALVSDITSPSHCRFTPEEHHVWPTHTIITTLSHTHSHMFTALMQQGLLASKSCVTMETVGIQMVLLA